MKEGKKEARQIECRFVLVLIVIGETKGRPWQMDEELKFSILRRGGFRRRGNPVAASHTVVHDHSRRVEA